MLRRHFLPQIRPYWRSIALATLSLVAVSGLGLLKPWPLKFLFDQVLSPTPGKQLSAEPGTFIVLIGGAIVLIAAAEGLLGYINDYFLAAAAQRISFGLRVTVFSHIQRLPLTFFERQRTGDLITRVTADVDKALELISDDVVSSLSGLFTIVGVIIIMLKMDWQLAVLMLAVTPLIYVFLNTFRSRIRSQSETVRSREGQMASLTQETLSAIKVVKAYSSEQYSEDDFREKAQEALDAGLEVTRLEARFGWLLNVVLALVTAAVVIIGSFNVLSGIITVGTLVVFISYANSFYSPVRTFSRLSNKFSKARVRLERVAEVLDQQMEVSERGDSRPASPFRGQIAFENVSFSYLQDKPTLTDINVTAQPGDVLALVGPTGSGKTTLASLVLRLYDPTQGSVKIDGNDVCGMTLDSLRGQIALVLQETVLFRATVRENIAYGRPSASRTEIEKASKAAGAHDFIVKLPDGYDTVLGERGSTVSGGQRQLIAIARALIRNSPILILDEPTTGLDARSEAEVIASLEKLMAGRTTLLITHKLSLVERATQIVVLKDGRIVEHGRHQELMRTGGLYSQLYTQQTGAAEAAGH